MVAAVHATEAVLKVLRRLEDAHGPLLLFQSGGCCDGTHPLCLTRDELPIAPSDVCLGEVGGVPVYIDSEQYDRWGRPRFEIDVAPGAADGFSLESSEGVHFVTSTPDQPMDW
ncbi:MAG: DUF779 domain-containing protein [Solirubrobacteraceae bacterium]